MDEKVHRDLGAQGAQIEALRERVSAMERKIDEVLNVLSQAKGGWKTLMLVAGIAGSMGALAHKFLGALHLIKP